MYIVLSLAAVTYQQGPQDISDCYYVNTSLDMIQLDNQININLHRTNKDACQVLQPGINVSVKMNYVDPTNQSIIQIEVFDYAYDFNYSSTDTISIYVNQSLNTNFKYFYLARAALVTINSITYSTSIIIGLINRITADNSMFISNNDSQVYFTETNICYNTTLRVSYINNFQQNDLFNVSVTISDYAFANGTLGNLTMIKQVQQVTGNNSINAPPPNQNVYNNSTITFDSTDNSFTICFPIPGYQVYQSIDISQSQGNMEIYYKATNTTANNSVVLYFSDITHFYNFEPMSELYSKLYVILMRDRILMQTFITDKTEQQNYEQILAKAPNYTANKLIYMYCATNESVFGAVYSKTNIALTNDTEVFMKNYYTPNQSAIPVIDKFYKYRQQNKLCNLQFQLTMFANNPATNKTIIQYQQDGTKAYFTCFSQVKVEQNNKITQLFFIRNDFPCVTFNKTGQNVILAIFDSQNDVLLSYHKVENFGTDNLVQQISINYTINESNTIMYIAQANGQILDAMPIDQLSEVHFDVLVAKGIAIISFGAIQMIFVSSSIICRQKIFPMVRQFKDKRQMILHSRKLAMSDGL